MRGRVNQGWVSQAALDGGLGLSEEGEVPVKIGELLEARSAGDFAVWLDARGATTREIWVVIYKKASGKQGVTLQELIEVALCYGWVDSQSKSVDAEKYALRFTPRRPRSNWTERNKAIARRLTAEGRMTDAGRAALPPDVLRD